MIFIPRRQFLLFIILSIAALLGMGISAYHLYLPQFSGSPLRQKIAAEWFLFSAVAVSLVLTALAVRMWLVRGRIKRELDRIRSMSTYVSLTSQLKSKRLYELGPLLSDLFLQVSRINERQSLKMSAQNTLVELLIDNIQAPLAVTDILGRIIYLSDEFEKLMKEDRDKLLGENLEKIISNVYMQMLVENIDLQRSYKKEQDEDRAFTVYPVYNRNREITYLVFDMRLRSSLTRTSDVSVQPGGQERGGSSSGRLSPNWKSLHELFGRFLRSGRNQSRD